MRVDDIYDAEDEQRRILRILGKWYLWVQEVWHGLVQGALPTLTPDEFRLDDVATRKMLALAAERAVGLTRSDRDQLREVLREGQRRGYSDLEIADGVPADGYGGIDGLYLTTWRSRSETIARTELATAQVAASLDRYAATGLVSHVRLVENEDTDEPCASRNGTVVPLSEKPGLLHPNCRLGLVPVVDEAA